MNFTACEVGIPLRKTLDQAVGTCIPAKVRSICSEGGPGLSRFSSAVGLLQRAGFLSPQHDPGPKPFAEASYA